MAKILLARIVLFFVATCLVCHTATSASGQDNAAAPVNATFEAEAKISIAVKGGLANDVAKTHAALPMAPKIIERAVKSGKLDGLKSLAGGDPVKTILAGLSVAIDSTSPTNVLVLSYRGSNAGDCLAILSALANTYVGFCAEAHNGYCDQTINLVSNARDVLKKDLAEAEIKYLEFRKSMPMQGDFGKTMIQALDQKRAVLLIRRAELRTSLKWADSAAADAELHTAVWLKATEWAARSGYERLPKQLRDKMTPLGAYINALKGELAENDLLADELDILLRQAKVKARELHDLEFQDEALRKNIARVSTIYDASAKRLQEINLMRDAGLDIRVIMPPRLRGTEKRLEDSKKRQPSPDGNRARLEADLRLLLQSLGAEHPKVIALKERIASLNDRKEEPLAKTLVVLSKQKVNATLSDARLRVVAGRSFLVGVEIESQITKSRFRGRVIWIPLDDVTQLIELEDAKAEK